MCGVRVDIRDCGRQKDVMSPSPRADAGPTAVSFNAGDGQGAARGFPRAAP